MIAIDPQRRDIDLEAVLMTIVWLENLATGQADVSNAEFSVVTRLPFTLDIEQNSHHRWMGILTSSFPWGAVNIISSILRGLRQHEETARIFREALI